MKLELDNIEPPVKELPKFQLAEDQLAAVEELTKWWNGKDQDFILCGCPGTGKTFLARYFINSLRGVVPLFTAPTNEAVRQLELSLQGAALTKTTYSALGLSLSMQSHKQKIYQRQLPDDFNDFNLLVVDEASMAGLRNKGEKNSHDLLIDYVRRAGMRTIWLGDWAQLPPIEATDGDSPIFNLGIPSYELSTIKRHSGDILDWAMALRAEIDKPVRNMPEPPSGVKTVKRNSAGLIDFTDDQFDHIISGQGRVITWTNGVTKYSKLPGVNEYNFAVRSRLFGEGLARESLIYPTDRILFASPLILASDGKHETLAFEDLLTDKIKFEVKASVNSKAEVLKAEYFLLMGVECWKTELEMEGGRNEIAYIPTKLGEVIKAAFEGDIRKRAIAAGAQKEASKLWEFYHTYRQCFADIKHIYCITGHRSQGSTISEVFVDVGNILQNRDRKIAFKNLYVSATRAKDSLYLVRG
jgi:exodeoxyribonuclease-5